MCDDVACVWPGKKEEVSVDQILNNEEFRGENFYVQVCDQFQIRP